MYNDLSIIIVARLASSRLYGKALLPIVHGLNSIDILYNRLSRLFGASRVIIATSQCRSNLPLVYYCKYKNIPYYTGSDLNVLERILGASIALGNSSVIARVTADNPLTDPTTIQNMYQFHIDHQSDYTFSPLTPNGLRAELISSPFAFHLLNNIANPLNTEFLTYYLMQDIGQSIMKYVDPALSPYRKYDFTIDHSHQYAAICTFLEPLSSSEYLNQSSDRLITSLHSRLSHLPVYTSTLQPIEFSQYAINAIYKK